MIYTFDVGERIRIGNAELFFYVACPREYEGGILIGAETADGKSRVVFTDNYRDDGLEQIAAFLEMYQLGKSHLLNIPPTLRSL